jgi:hypothetical protein
MAAVKRRTFAHPDQPMPGPASGLASFHSWSIIEYLDLKFRGPVLESDVSC